MTPARKTMRVKFLTSMAGEMGGKPVSYRPGDEADIPTKDAKGLLDARYAEAVKRTAKAKAETATA